MRNQERDDGEHRGHQPRELTLPARRSAHCGLREAAADDHAARQPRTDVRCPQAEQLAVRIDLVPLFGRIGLCRPEPFRERDDHDAERRAEQAEEVRGRDVGDLETGKPALDRSDGRDAVQTEEMHRQDPEQHRHERGRDGAVPYLQSENQHEGQHADEQRQASRLIDVLDELPELLEEVAGALLDAEQLRELAHDDRQGQSDDEPLQDRL